MLCRLLIYLFIYLFDYLYFLVLYWLGRGFLLFLKINLFFVHYLLHAYYTIFTYLFI